MDIRILPIMVNKAGENLFPAVRKDNHLELAFVSYSQIGAPQTATLLEQMQSMLILEDSNQFWVGEIPHASEDLTYFIVAGKEASISPSDTGVKWINPAAIKFGPPPKSATAKKKGDNILWVGTMDQDQRVALLSAVLTLRALRIGAAPSDESLGSLAVIAKSMRAMASFMDYTIDRGLPKFTTEPVPLKRDTWRQLVRGMTKLAGEVTQRMQQGTPAKPKVPAAKKKKTGFDPKPA
jgi:hypothetical protein